MTKRTFKMKPEKKGFTVVELLVVLAIIAILMGILIPAVGFVRNTAKETKQKVQLAAIDMALMVFRGDYGDYPSSNIGLEEPFDYCGTQKLTEALLGWDLLGFHPDSDWKSGGSAYNSSEENLSKRIGPYLEVETINVFRLSDLFTTFGNVPWRLAQDTYVICDIFDVPILYYRANENSKLHNAGFIEDRIYNAFDNKTLTELKPHPLADDGTVSFVYFYNYITNPKITTMDWPYRPNSYILISAGVDGLYGTNDDICNF